MTWEQDITRTTNGLRKLSRFIKTNCYLTSMTTMECSNRATSSPFLDTELISSTSISTHEPIRRAIDTIAMMATDTRDLDNCLTLNSDGAIEEVLKKSTDYGESLDQRPITIAKRILICDQG